MHSVSTVQCTVCIDGADGPVTETVRETTKNAPYLTIVKIFQKRVQPLLRHIPN